jgi:hypothetical protein
MSRIYKWLDENEWIEFLELIAELFGPGIANWLATYAPWVLLILFGAVSCGVVVGAAVISVRLFRRGSPLRARSASDVLGQFKIIDDAALSYVCVSIMGWVWFAPFIEQGARHASLALSAVVVLVLLICTAGLFRYGLLYWGTKPYGQWLMRYVVSRFGFAAAISSVVFAISVESGWPLVGFLPDLAAFGLFDPVKISKNLEKAASDGLPHDRGKGTNSGDRQI